MNPNTDQDQVFVSIDLSQAPELEQKLKHEARNHGLKLNDYLLAVLTKQWLHPVKSLTLGSTVEQDQLAPSDLLPSKVGFDNSPVG